MTLLIFDKGDATYHYGEGDWGPDKNKAKEYLTHGEAEEGIEDVDNASILRHRLLIVVKGRT